MKTPDLQRNIVAYLRSLGRPETSRALAARFLRIDRADEETCRRLLAPFLATVPGVVHRGEQGWSLGGGASDRVEESPQADMPPTARSLSSAQEGLGDFVALASEGQGPGGSGTPVMVSLVPVVAGEECQAEQFPAWDLDDESGPPGVSPGGGLTPSVLEEIAQTIGDLPIVCHRAGREVEPLRRLCSAAGLPFQAPVISAAKIGHLLFGLKPSHAVSDLAQALGIATRGPDDCRGRARLIASAFLRLTPLLEERGIDRLDALLEYQDMPAAPVDLSSYDFSAEDLKSLPAAPGVYSFLDREGEVIYVGKAKNLRIRVGSYFTPSARGQAKGRAVLEQVRSLRFERVASELEANLREAALIARHRPRLNRQFDVHERAAPYGPRLNLVVVLRDAPSGSTPGPACTLHLLRGGRYLACLAGLPPAPAAAGGKWEEARAMIARLYFPEAPDEGRSAQVAGGGFSLAGDEGVDIDWQLVGSFVRKYRDEINVLDLDECASPAEAERRLRVLVEAAVAGPGRIVAR